MFIAATKTPLPASLTSLLEGTTNTKCRIGWKMIRTGYRSHGDWFELKDEAMLQGEIDDLNKRYAGEMHHWLEYK
jgi:hypothetical protein